MWEVVNVVVYVVVAGGLGTLLWEVHGLHREVLAQEARLRLLDTDRMRDQARIDKLEAQKALLRPPLLQRASKR